MSNNIQLFDYDSLEHPLIGAYFTLMEHLSYYRSLKKSKDQHDFHDKLMPLLERFIEDAQKPGSERLLEETVLKQENKQRSHEGSVIVAAKHINPQGFNLLALKGTLDFDILKKNYRAAVKKYHPDCGGNHEDMVVINVAFNQFHELLCNIKGNSNSSDIRDSRDVLFTLNLIFARIYFDDWALDKVQEILQVIHSSNWVRSESQQKSMFYFCCLVVAIRFRGLERDKEADEVYNLGVTYYYPKENDPGYQYYMHQIKRAKNKKKGRMVLNHRRQAENALRLGLITNKRFIQIMARTESQSKIPFENQEKLDHYLQENDLIQSLPTDTCASAKVTRKEMIPEPGYFETIISELSGDQQAEYSKAFKGNYCELILKYQYVRYESLLYSTIYYLDNVSLPQVLREIEFLSNLKPSPLGNAILDLVKFFNSSDRNQLEKRLKILTELDQKHYYYQIRLHLDYCRLAKQNTTELENILKKDEEDLRHERLQNYQVLGEDSSKMQALKPPGLYSCLEQAKECPEKVVEIVEPYWKRLIELISSDSITFSEYSGIADWTNDLSIAYTRLFKWQQAKQCLEAYFKLPERCQSRSAKSTVKAMEKRLSNCRYRFSD